jgi:hypothetical protein
MAPPSPCSQRFHHLRRIQIASHLDIDHSQPQFQPPRTLSHVCQLSCTRQCRPWRQRRLSARRRRGRRRTSSSSRTRRRATSTRRATSRCACCAPRRGRTSPSPPPSQRAARCFRTPMRRWRSTRTARGCGTRHTRTASTTASTGRPTTSGLHVPAQGHGLPHAGRRARAPP